MSDRVPLIPIPSGELCYLCDEGFEEGDPVYRIRKQDETIGYVHRVCLEEMTVPVHEMSKSIH